MFFSRGRKPLRRERGLLMTGTLLHVTGEAVVTEVRLRLRRQSAHVAHTAEGPLARGV